MSVAIRSHWLLLVTVVALAVAAYVAFVLGSGAAEAHPSTGFHWHSGAYPWGEWWRCLYNAAGQWTGICQ